MRTSRTDPLSQALERVASHCAEVRTLLAKHSRTPYTTGQARSTKQVEGGIMLSLDISRAYDSVSRETLAATLTDAEVPRPLAEAILAVHNQACIQVVQQRPPADSPATHWFAPGMWTLPDFSGLWSLAGSLDSSRAWHWQRRPDPPQCMPMIFFANGPSPLAKTSRKPIAKSGRSLYVCEIMDWRSAPPRR